MNRRELILASLGTASVVLPRIVSAASKPCAPPLVSVAGGSSASTVCTVATGKTYATSFPSNENPISEGGRWHNSGLDWTAVATTNGVAHSTQTGNSYDDSYAFLAGFSANHQAQGTIFKANGYNPGTTHEIEILLRCSDSPHNISYYECNLEHDGAYAQIVKLVGPIGQFEVLNTTVSQPIRPKTGDVFMAKIVGNTISSYLNGVKMAEAVDSSIGAGQPGMAFFIRPGATAQSYGFSSYSATDI